MNKIFQRSNRLMVISLASLLVSWSSSLALAKSKVEEEVKHSSALTKDGKVQIENVNGRIRVTGWDRAEVEMVAVKRGDRQADLDAVKIEIDAKPNHIRIQTEYPKSKWSLWQRSNSTSVDYELKVPSGANLEGVENVNGSVEVEGVHGAVHASTVNGKLTAKGLAGDADLESVNGPVHATFERFDGVKKVSLNAVNGKISLTLPANANAEVSAETVNGSIQTGPELPVTKHWPVGTELKGKLGKGGTQVRAETVNGAISIAQAGTNAKAAAPEGKVKVEDDK